MNTKLITATFTPGTSYAVGNNFGGKLTFQTGFVGNPVNVQIRRVFIAGSAATLTASANLGFLLFNSNPSTTFTDAASPTWTASDNSKVNSVYFIAGLTTVNGSITNTYVSQISASSPTNVLNTVQTDSSGNLYAALTSGGTWTMTTPAAFTVTLEIGF